jgi:hypothetical protein
MEAPVEEEFLNHVNENRFYARFMFMFMMHMRFMGQTRRLLRLNHLAHACIVESLSARHTGNLNAIQLGRFHQVAFTTLPRPAWLRRFECALSGPFNAL